MTTQQLIVTQLHQLVVVFTLVAEQQQFQVQAQQSVATLQVHLVQLVLVSVLLVQPLQWQTQLSAQTLVIMVLVYTFQVVHSH